MTTGKVGLTARCTAWLQLGPVDDVAVCKLEEDIPTGSSALQWGPVDDDGERILRPRVRPARPTLQWGPVDDDGERGPTA